MARRADPRVRARIAKNLNRLLGPTENGAAAKKVGMSQAQLSGYANGHRGFSVETLLRLAGALEFPLDELVHGVDVEYARSVAKRLHAELEDDDDLLDVITCFEMIRRENMDEARSIVGMFRARMLSLAASVPRASAQNDDTSVAAAETSSRTIRPSTVPQRR